MLKLLISACVIGAGILSVLPQELQENDDRCYQSVLRLQNVSLTGEFLTLQNVLDLDPESMDLVKLNLSKDIDKAIHRLSRECSDSDVKKAVPLDSEIRQLLWLKIGEMLPESKKVRFENYKATSMRLQELQDICAVDSIVLFLDKRLFLSEKQIDLVREMYLKNWNYQLNDIAFLIHSCDYQLRELTDQSELEKLLSKKQIEGFQKLITEPDFNGNRIPGLVGGNAWSSNYLRDLCMNMMELKNAEYEGLVELTDIQRKKLKVSMKKVALDIVNDYEEAQANPIGFDPDIFQFVCDPTESIEERLLRKKTYEIVFDDGQYQRIGERETVRQAMVTAQLVNMVVFSIGRNEISLGLTYDQHLKMVKLIEKYSADLTDYEASSKAICSATDEELSEFLSKRQIELLETICEQLESE